MLSILKTALVCALLTSALTAATIQFGSVPTGVNDGQYYVTPYQITIDGTSTLVTCYDVFDDVNFGDIWQANILTVEQAAMSGYFFGSTNPTGLAGYQRVAWLDAQTYANPDQQVGLQHAIWNVFGTASSSASALSYEAAADTAAANSYAGFDFSRTRFIEQVGGVAGQSGTEQAFVYQLAASGRAGQEAVAPEPGTLALFGGIALFFTARYFQRKRRPA